MDPNDLLDGEPGGDADAVDEEGEEGESGKLPGAGAPDDEETETLDESGEI